MSAPLAKGIIIAASVLVAAGIAMYENEQVRLWLDERRRRIAVALYNMGDGINPQTQQRHAMAFGAGASASPTEGMVETTDVQEDQAREHRRRVVMQNKRELLRRAKEDGVAVDLDVLSALSLEAELLEAASMEYGVVNERADAGRKGDSFDSIVGKDGKLREGDIKASSSRAPEMKQKIDIPIVMGESSSSQPFENIDGLRHRSVAPASEAASSVRGFNAGAAWANPFDDEAQVLFDQSLIGPTEDELPDAPPAIAESPAPVTAPAVVQPAPIPPREPFAEQLRLIDIPVQNAAQAAPARPYAPSYPIRQAHYDDLVHYKSDEELNAEIERAIRISLAEAKEHADAEEAIRLSIVEAERADALRRMEDAQRNFQAGRGPYHAGWTFTEGSPQPPVEDRVYPSAEFEQFAASQRGFGSPIAHPLPESTVSPREEPLDESLYGMPSPRPLLQRGLVPVHVTPQSSASSSTWKKNLPPPPVVEPTPKQSPAPSSRTVSAEPVLEEDLSATFVLPSFPALEPVRVAAAEVVSAQASLESLTARAGEPVSLPAVAPSTTTLVNVEQDLARNETHDDELAKTPTTEGGFSFASAPSNAGSDIDVEMMDVDEDQRSETGMSEFSVISAATPGSWTDVDTDDDIEEVGNGVRVAEGGAPTGSASVMRTGQ